MGRVAKAPLAWLALASAWACAPGTAPDAGADALPPAGPTLEPEAESAFITRRGTELLERGEPFVPEGVGSYPLLEHAGNGRLDWVEDVFQQAHDLGRPLLRTNAFFDGGDNPARLRNDDGTLNEAGLVGLDRLVAAAARHHVRLILVLANNWKDYGGAPAVVRILDAELPKQAFWSYPPVVRAQIDYVVELVTRINTANGIRYARDPTIFAWELANEARCSHADWCDYRTLERWAATMVDAVRDAGAQQLVAWGGSGHEGRYGEYLSRIARHSGVDLLTLHVYPFTMDPSLRRIRDFEARVQAASRAGAERIAGAAQVARDHGLPLLVEELGWLPPKGPKRDLERALVLSAWLAEASRWGAGTLPWMIAEPGRPNFDGLLIRPQSDRLTVRAIRWP